MMATKTLRNDVILFAPIDLAKVSQQDDGTILVPAVFSTERVDDQGERVTYEALQKAAPDYMEWAAVNEMHQLSAVGTTVELNLDDTLRKASGTLHIVDPVAVQKVLTGVYRGTSIEGRKLHRSLSKAAGTKWDVDDIQWNRISLADRPSNPDAVLLLAKAAGASEETPVDEKAVEPLEKTAVDDAAGAGMALNVVNLLIEHESAEATAEPAQIAFLRTAQTALVAFMGLEAAEIGTPEEVAEVAEATEAPVIVAVLENAEPVGDLQKVSDQLQALTDRLDRLEKTTPAEIVTLGTSESPDFGALLKVALSDDDTLAKVATVVSDRIGTANQTALDAMKVELLASFTPAKELLEKVAKMASPGGPVRYAERGGRIGTEEEDDGDSSSALLKAAGAMEKRDPSAAASLRQAAAEQQIQRLRTGR
jgi:hypothetical protein